jgi:hypothetical protein
LRLALSIEVQLSCSDVGDITAFAEKLHDFLAGTRHLRPARFRCGILFQAAKLLPFEMKVDLTQSLFRRPTNRETIATQMNFFGVVDESLRPNVEQGLFEGRLHDWRERRGLGGKQARN